MDDLDSDEFSYSDEEYDVIYKLYNSLPGHPSGGTAFRRLEVVLVAWCFMRKDKGFPINVLSMIIVLNEMYKRKIPANGSII